MNSVEDYIFNQEPELSELLQFLHLMLVGDFGLQPKLRFKIPFYFSSTWICYINPLKKGGVEFVYIKGQELSNEHGLLDSKGRKMVAGIFIKNLTEVPVEAIQESLSEAILLSEK